MNKIFFILFFFKFIILFGQLNIISNSLEVCNANDPFNLKDCESFEVKTLITINDEFTMLKIINSSQSYEYFITEKTINEEKRVALLTLVRDDGLDYVLEMDGNEKFVKILYFDEEGTYATIFYYD